MAGHKTETRTWIAGSGNWDQPDPTRTRTETKTKTQTQTRTVQNLGPLYQAGGLFGMGAVLGWRPRRNQARPRQDRRRKTRLRERGCKMHRRKGHRPKGGGRANDKKKQMKHEYRYEENQGCVRKDRRRRRDGMFELPFCSSLRQRLRQRCWW